MITLNGRTFQRHQDTYAAEVCDYCGLKRKCDWYDCTNDPRFTGMDLCRTCSKRLEGKEIVIS